MAADRRSAAQLGRAVAGGFVCAAALSRDPWLAPLGGNPEMAAGIERARAASARARAAFAAAGGPDLLA